MVAHLIKGHCKVKEDYSDPLQGPAMFIIMKIAVCLHTRLAKFSMAH